MDLTGYGDKITGMEPVLPILNMTPSAFAQIAWASLPAVAFGAGVAAVLIYIKMLAARVEQPDGVTGWRMWVQWPLYLLRHVGVWYLGVVGLSIAAGMAPIADEAKHVVGLVYSVVTIIQVALLIAAVFEEACRSYLRRTRADGGRRLLVNTLITVGKLIVWAIAAVAILGAVGVNVTGLVAGLGLGGVALALASKSLLENMFASFSMVLNPPFVIGDFIAGGEILGTVENINLKYVLIRQLSGEQLSVPSSDILNMKVRNYSRMRERRVEFRFGVGYSTMTAKKLERIPQLIRKAIEAQGEKVRFDRAHFAGYGDLMLMFEGVYMVTSADYNLHMDVQQDILTRIYKALEKEGVEMALGFRVGNANDLMGLKEMQKAGLPTGLGEKK